MQSASGSSRQVPTQLLGRLTPADQLTPGVARQRVRPRGVRTASEDCREPRDWPEPGPAEHHPLVSSALLGVVARAIPVDDDSRLVADDPAVVAARQRGYIARSRDELGPVVHADREPAAHVVLEVRRVAAVGASDRLHVVRPAPPGLENVSADVAAADVEDLRGAIGEFTDFVGVLEALVLGLLVRILG